MTRYKLKQNLPKWNIWDEVQLQNKWVEKSNCITDMKWNILALIEPKDIPEWLEEIKENKRWRAEYRKKYFYIDSCWTIWSVSEDKDTLHDYRYKSWNYYETEEQAQKALDRINAIAELNMIIDEKNEGWEPDWSNENEKKWSIFSTKWEYYTDCNCTTRNAFITNYIVSRQVSDYIIENHRDLLDKIFD